MSNENNNTKDNQITERYIIERKYTNEITPIQAILPLVVEELQRKRNQYIKEKAKWNINRTFENTRIIK